MAALLFPHHNMVNETVGWKTQTFKSLRALRGDGQSGIECLARAAGSSAVLKMLNSGVKKGKEKKKNSRSRHPTPPHPHPSHTPPAQFGPKLDEIKTY